MSTKTQAAQSQKPSSNLPAVISPERGKNDLMKQETEIKGLNTFTAEQRIGNLKNFTLLSERFSHLKKKQDELTAFSISNDNTEEQFRLTNSTGFIFQSSNTDVINKIVSLLNDHIEERLEDTKKEILEFSI